MVKFNPVPLLLILIVLLPSSSVNQGKVRIMSYNIKAGQETSISQIAEVIKFQEPDIVALQEVDVHWGERSNCKDQVRYLGNILDMNYFFGEIYALPSASGRGKLRKYGLAFLSKYPIQSSNNRTITRLSSLEDKPEPQQLPGFIEISVRINGRRIQLFNTHLDYRSNGTIRKAQVDDMLPFLAKDEFPKVLLGDLNAEPGDPEIHQLFKLLKDAGKGRNGQMLTYPAASPHKRIDYILYSNDFELQEIFVVDTRASDHRPVVADLILK